MKNIDGTRRVLADDMKKYVELILKEYGACIPESTREELGSIDDYINNIVVEDTGTISMFAEGTSVIMPEGAYKIFKYMKLVPGYGINKNHKSYADGEIINDNTYFDYIKHVLISGMDVEEFFRDTLLHETMHVCGSGGADAIREGFTELKTRELAKKHGLKASRCGYPKEVGIASEFQELVGEDMGNMITFAEDDKQIYAVLQEKCGDKIANLYFEISSLMNEELDRKYDHSKFGGLMGPIKKAQAYSSIDYTKVYEKIEALKKERDEDIKRVDVIDSIRGCNAKEYKDKLKDASIQYDSMPKSQREGIDMEK